MHTHSSKARFGPSTESDGSYHYVDTGIIAGNVYLFAASEGLACWFHNCDRAGLARSLRLSETQEALFAQTIGYAAKPGLDCP